MLAPNTFHVLVLMCMRPKVFEMKFIASRNGHVSES